MKKLYLILLLFCLSRTATYAQSSCITCGSKGITTNPLAPVNQENPSKRNTFFDWTNLGQFDVFSQYWPTPYNKIESPYNQNGNLPLAHFITNPDRLSKNGWELLRYNLGFTESNLPNGLANRNIYIILYNKYTGIMRVFVAANEITPYNGLITYLTFANGNQSNLVSNGAEMFALDQFKGRDSIQSVAKQIPSLWAYSDFRISYDPCTCENESKMGVGFQYLNTSTLTLDGSLKGDIVTKDSNGQTDVKEDGYSFVKKAIKSGVQAYKTYDSFQGFSNDQFSAIDNEGLTNSEVAAKAAATKNSINLFQQVIKSSKFLQTGLKAIPYVGAALSFIDAFIGGGNEGPQEVKIMPMTIQANVKLRGQLKSVYDFPGATITTPGSKNALCASDGFYSYYNETLGIFNLLETPTYKEIVVPAKTTCNNDFPRNCVTTPGYSYFRMADHIRYAVNSSAQMDVQEIQSQVIVKQIRTNKSDSIIWSTPFLPLATIKDFNLQKLNPSTTKVFLKLMINFKRKDAGPDTQNLLFVVTYPVQGSKPGPFVGWQDLYDNSYNTTADLLQSYPSQLTINTSQNLASNIGALNDITLQRGQQIIRYDWLRQPDGRYEWVPVYGPMDISITSSNGSKIIAGNSIAALDGVSLRTGAILATGMPNSNNNVAVSQTDAVIKSFCQSSVYKVASRNLRVASPEELPILSYNFEAAESKSTLAFPNPTTGKVSFRYYIEEPTHVRLNLLSSIGNVVATPVDTYQEAGPYELAYDANNLPAGVYIYTLETNKGKQTKRLVVLK